MAETSGEILGGRYRLLGERTSFPFGAWWEAEDDQGARVVVLRMNPEVADPAAKAKAAVAASARVDSPHVVPWVDGGVDAKGHGWLAAPMYGPWSLNEHVSRGEGVPPAEAALLVHQLARAAAAAEAAGVPHNTLTAEFVRLVPIPDGGHGVKVYGYGLAELLPSYKPLRKQDAYLGVPDYMSPELCAGKTAEGSSADIYAIGILMYEAVRGRPPFAPTFASASASTTLKRHIFEKPLPLHVRYANAAFIKSYENICFKALAKTANRRQATLAELATELEQLIVEEMHAQVVSLSAVSGRGPTTARRLRTQVIAQIPVDEPKVSAAPAAPAASPAPAASTTPAPAPSAPATPAPAAPAPAIAAAAAPAPAAEPSRPTPSPTEASRVAPTVAAMPAATKGAEAERAAPEEEAPKRTDSTLVFAGLGPAVREMAEAARKTDEEEESAEEEGVPSTAGASAAGPVIRGKKKKGRKASTGVTVVSGSSTTAERPKAPSTTPAAATIVTPKASEAPTGERVGTPAGVTTEAPQARIRRKEEATALAAPPKERKPEPKGADDQEEWFSDAEGARKRSRAWIVLLLVAVVIALVVLLLMSGGKNDGATDQPPTTGTSQGQPATTGPAGAATPAAVAPANAPSAPAPAPAPTEPAAAPAEAPKPAEPAPAGAPKPPEPTPAEAPKPAEPKPAEAPKPTEAPKPAEATKPAEPAKVEAKPVEPPKAETKPAEPPKVETKPAQTAPAPSEAPKVEATPPKPAEPAVTQPKTEPPKDAPGSLEEQFRAQAKKYLELGIQAYKGENYKLAVGYFKKAQEADPNNALAAQYLKKALEKVGE